MEDVPCCHCGGFFVPSPRHKNQNYCMKPDCRRAKNTAWKYEKMRTDPEFRLNQQLSNKKWAKANPNYWKEYRRENPKKPREIGNFKLFAIVVDPKNQTVHQHQITL